MIDALEDTVGERLFHRKRSVGISLTSAGERLLPRALSLLRDAKSIGRDLGSAGLDGELTIGATVSLASTVVPRMLERLALDHPLLKVQVVVKSAEELLTLLGLGRIELLLSYATSSPLQKLSTEKLFETRFGLIAKKDRYPASCRNVDIRSLAGMPIVILDNAISRQKLFDYLSGAQAGEIDVHYRVGTLPLCLQIVQRQLAQAIVPLFSLMKNDIPEDVGCYELDPPPSSLSASVSWAPNVSLSPAALACVQILQTLKVSQDW